MTPIKTWITKADPSSFPFACACLIALEDGTYSRCGGATHVLKHYGGNGIRTPICEACLKRRYGKKATRETIAAKAPAA